MAAIESIMVKIPKWVVFCEVTVVKPNSTYGWVQQEEFFNKTDGTSAGTSYK